MNVNRLSESGARPPLTLSGEALAHACRKKAFRTAEALRTSLESHGYQVKPFTITGSLAPGGQIFRLQTRLDALDYDITPKELQQRTTDEKVQAFSGLCLNAVRRASPGFRVAVEVAAEGNVTAYQITFDLSK